MGVSGKGLRSDGLHKQYLNGSQEDHNSAASRTRTGGSAKVSNANGLNKAYGNVIPHETANPVSRGKPKRLGD